MATQMPDPERIPKALCWAVFVLAILTLIGGLGHSAAVISVVVKQKRAYDPGAVLLFTTGGMLLYISVWHLVLSQKMRTGKAWAIPVSAALTCGFCLYLVLLIPLRTGSAPRYILALWGTYFIWLLATWWKTSRAKRDAA